MNLEVVRLWSTVFGQGSKVAVVLALYITVGMFSSFVYMCLYVCGGGTLSLVRGVSALLYLPSISLLIYFLRRIIFSM